VSMRKLMPATAAVAALTLAVPGIATATTNRNAAQPVTHNTLASHAAHNNARQAANRRAFGQAPAVPAAAGNCSGALRYSARHPRQVVSCMTAGTPAGRTGRVITRKEGFPVTCDSLPTVVWYYGRFQICLEDFFTEYEVVNGKVKGTAKFSYAQQLDFAPRSLQWTEADYARLDSVSGISKTNSLGWVTKCSGSCAPAKRTVFPVTPIKVHQTLHGTATFAGTPAKGTTGTLSAQPTVTVVDPVGKPEAYPITLAKSLEARCDSQVAVSNTSGCVIPIYVPVFTVSLASSGASAAMIQWAQTNLSGHWGLQGSGQPLRRLASDSKARANRNRICDGSFVSGSTNVADDSCDEFPFAKTYESGNLNGVTAGSQCAQVTAIRTANAGTVAQQWAKISVIGKPAASEKCVRGHIPLPLNTDVGGGLGRFAQAQRLIDNDEYWLAVTP